MVQPSWVRSVVGGWADRPERVWFLAQEWPAREREADDDTAIRQLQLLRDTVSIDGRARYVVIPAGGWAGLLQREAAHI